MSSKRWLGISLGALAALAATALGTLYALSARTISEAHAVTAPTFALPLPTDSAALAEGERLARTRGCLGCHGDDLGGRVFFSERGVAHLPAPNLTRLVRERTPAELERAIRHGIRTDGTALYAMPAEMYRSLRDEDLARLLAFIRVQPEVDRDVGARQFGPLGRVGIVSGEFQHSVHYINTETPLPAPADTAQQLGHYIAITSCTECHTNTMEGDEGSPSIPAILPSYTREEFADFLRTGTAKGGRELPMMSRVARGRLSHLTPREVESLYDYLVGLKPSAATPDGN